MSISRWSNFTGAKHGYKNAHHNHKARRGARKRGAPECRRIRKALANFDQPITNRRPLCCPKWRRECKRPTKLAPALARALEQDKELNARSATQAELDGEQNVSRAAHQMIETAADSVISPNTSFPSSAASTAIHTGKRYVILRRTTRPFTRSLSSLVDCFRPSHEDSEDCRLAACAIFAIFPQPSYAAPTYRADSIKTRQPRRAEIPNEPILVEPRPARRRVRADPGRGENV